MKRRQIIQNVGAGLAIAAAGACGQASNAPSVQAGDLPNVRWRMVTSWPQSLGETIFGGATTVCDRVKEMTGGRFTIEPYVAGEIVPGLEVMDAVQNGTVECGHTASYYYVGKNPALGFGTAMPFGLTASQQNAWLYHGGGLDALHKVYVDFNIINFPAGNTGTQMGGWFKRKIETVSDLNGLKMRIPGLGGKVMAELGVNVQVIAGGEIFLALERGTIDAAEWVGPYDDEKLGLQKAAPFYYYPGWWEPGATLEVQINLEKWNELPTEYQEILKAAAKEANLNMQAQYEFLNGEALQRLLASDTQLAAYSPEILAAAQQVAFDIYEDTAAKEASFKEVFDNWREFRDRAIQWSSINQLYYQNFVSNS
ncbi:MAG: TRAP transporter substrate-binding protein [Cyanobacteria bacterium P01_H01_bin.15]